MTLRPATDGDQTTLFDLHRAVFREHIEKIWGWDEKWQRANFTAEFACAATSIIEQDGRIVGYVQILDKKIESMFRTSLFRRRTKAKALARAF